MQVWAMRFESKYRYFKRVMRHILNFKNVTKSLSEKHELFQSLIRCGSDKRIQTEFYNVTDFNWKLYNVKLQMIIKENHLCNSSQCERVTYNGTSYRKGDAIIIRQDCYKHNVIIGKICFFLYTGEKVFMNLEILDTEYLPYLQSYQIESTESTSYECHAIDKLIYHKPLPIYKLRNMLCIKPAFAFITDQF
ncbi:hypothetical protein TKK_0011764 [Trichogramma kaykai]